MMPETSDVRVNDNGPEASPTSNGHVDADAQESNLSPFKRPYSTLENSPRRTTEASDTAILSSSRNGTSFVSTHVSSQALRDVIEGTHSSARADSQLATSDSPVSDVLDIAARWRWIERCNSQQSDMKLVDSEWWETFKTAASSNMQTVPPVILASNGSEHQAVSKTVWDQLVKWFGLVGAADYEEDPQLDDIPTAPIIPITSDSAMDLNSEGGSPGSTNPMMSEPESEFDRPEVSIHTTNEVEQPSTYTVWIIPVANTGLGLAKLSVLKSEYNGSALFSQCLKALGDLNSECLSKLQIRLVQGEFSAEDLKNTSMLSDVQLAKLDTTPLDRLLNDGKEIFGSNDTAFCCATFIEPYLKNDKYCLPFNPQRVVLPGTTGLSNMGNTCYMNSALQCLLHVEELSSFFLSDAYVAELNRDNPIGCNGDMGTAFANLVKDVIPGKDRAFSPHTFKRTLVKYAQTFVGWAQQDTQEFLAFLLDSLHEDLNRILKKPAVPKPELPEGTSPNDEEVIVQLGEKSWETHKMRNDSIILDLFTGMYRSVLVCPECDKVSVTFDPFMDLTLPLPTASNHWIQDVHVVPMRGAGPLVVNVCIDRTASFSDLKAYLSKLTGISPGLLVGAEVYQSSFFAFYEDRDIVSATIGENDIAVFYELAQPVPNSNPGGALLSSTSMEQHSNDEVEPFGKSFAATVVFNNGPGSRLMGWPVILAVTAEMARNYESFEAAIVERFHYINEEDDSAQVGADLNEMQTSSVDDLYNRTHIPGDFPTPEADNDNSLGGFREIETEVRVDETQTHSDSDMEIVDAADAKPVFELKYIPPSSRAGIRQSPLYLSKPIRGRIRGENYVMVSNKQDTVSEGSISIGGVNEQDYGIEGSLIGGETMFDNADLNEEEGTVADMGDSFDNVGQDDVEDSLKTESAETEAEATLLFPGEEIVANWPTVSSYKVKKSVRLDNTQAEKAVREIAEKKLHVASLDDCLGVFSKTEVLSADDLWYCSQCQEHRQATKTIELWKVPDILIIQLKRFASFRSFRDKIDDAVDFPLEGLDMQKWIRAPKIDDDDESNHHLYDLFAIDDHFGGLRGGHYTATVKNYVDGNWYTCNDGNVRREVAPNTRSGSAYLLFYRRRSPDNKPLGGDYIADIVRKGRETLANWDYSRGTLQSLTPNTYDEYHAQKAEETDGPRWKHTRPPPPLPQRPGLYELSSTKENDAGTVLGRGTENSLLPWRTGVRHPFGADLQQGYSDNEVSDAGTSEIIVGRDGDSDDDDDFSTFQPLGG